MALSEQEVDQIAERVSERIVGKKETEHFECAPSDLSHVVNGIFDLGFAAGRLSQAVDKYGYKLLTGEEITQDDKEDLAAVGCHISDLAPVVWHRPDKESKFLLDKVVSNQVGGREPEDLCTFGSVALERPELWSTFFEALREIRDMLVEPCGQSHMEGIVGCATIGSKEWCDSLRSWREAREGVVQAGHKRRIPQESLHQALGEAGGGNPCRKRRR